MKNVAAFSVYLQHDFETTLRNNTTTYLFPTRRNSHLLLALSRPRASPFCRCVAHSVSIWGSHTRTGERALFVEVTVDAVDRNVALANGGFKLGTPCRHASLQVFVERGPCSGLRAARRSRHATVQ